MLEDLNVSGEFVLLNGEMAEKGNLYIEFVDYGDNVFDVQICKKDKNDLFGGMAWTAINGIKRTLSLIEEISKITGITDVRKFVSDIEI